MTSSWETLVKDMVTSTDVSETELRAFAAYQVVKDRLYMEVLCDVLSVLAKRGVESNDDVLMIVWGKVTAAGVSSASQTATGAQDGESEQLDQFAAYVEGMLLNDFGEEETVLNAYRGADSATVARVMGTQLCEATGCSASCPEGTFDKLADRVAMIERETTLEMLEATADQLETALLAISYVQTESHEHT